MATSDQQLCLFRHAKPLLDRFGQEFFRSAPKSPGVYWFTGVGERVLYVGQSKNLRLRLAFYKNAVPEKAPRKIIRMIHGTEKIQWEQCDSERHSKFRENELIRLHQPKFNVVNARSKTYSFFGWRFASDKIQIRLQMNSEPEADENLYGAFKGWGLCLQTFGALARLLWSAVRKPAVYTDLPIQLLRKTTPRKLILDQPSFLPADTAHSDSLLHHFFSGHSDSLLSSLELEMPRVCDPFLARMLQADLEVLHLFYERGPRRNLLLQERNGLSARLIPQDQLDDLLIPPPRLPASFAVKELQEAENIL